MKIMVTKRKEKKTVMGAAAAELAAKRLCVIRYDFFCSLLALLITG